ncbi:MAG TPA: Rieske (2Fe-2S) protein [Caulobacteraceae bacterium]|jgi:nitrite reductase/ring-hydroxylating ferredoxin subunit
MNPAAPPPGTRLCALAEIADPGSRGFTFRVDDRLFAGFVVRRDGRLVGYIDRCPHAGMPLALAPNRFLTRDGDLILCSAHGALFRITDGLCLGGPCAGKALSPWPVRVQGGAVVIAHDPNFVSGE